ncbi:NADH:flavin oxidoreductase/NADH oxidase [Coralliovum pocilloporae]|uniref:NADH:flavin oxidoreductase/NADH oxidase n=1 Tax=Coralliovum pocilloporae TaxID=3066369 RepID=UPI0033075982
MSSSPSALASPFTLRGLTFPNRVVISPMSQYRAKDGYANDWHLVHLGRFAMGGAGLVFAEATAVTEDGRRTHGDLGLWNDGQIEGLQRITRFLEAEGSVPGIQLAHAGRKASERRPWHGETPVDEEDRTTRGEAPWQASGPSALPYADGWPEPQDMTLDDINAVIRAFRDAARRSKEAGFKVIEVYAAHGFLLHQFYSPLSNQRNDVYGGSFDNRIRLACEVASAIREVWPDDYPLIFRISATDWVDGGWELEDSVALAKALKQRGVDMIDCSSGGIGGRERPRRMPLEQGFQAPLAEKVRTEAEIATMAVGFLWDPDKANEIISNGSADLVALAREVLTDPNWPHHAMDQMDGDLSYQRWHEEFGWWLSRRDRLLNKLELR